MGDIHLTSNLTGAPPLPSSPSVDNYLAYTPYLLANPSAILVSFFLIWYVNKDYKAFLSLGPGGTPYNFYGYMKITLLRLIALSDPCRPDPVPAHLYKTGYLSVSGVDKRSSERPEVVGIAPHRQKTQKADPEVIEMLNLSIRKLADDHPADLRIDTSTFEKHLPALFSVQEVNFTKSGEICHAHTYDGSLHMTLHPEDIKTVIEAGWGERHPLARGGFCSRFVPSGFVMIYAPRTREEVETVMQIIKAGVCWVRDEKFFDAKTETRSCKTQGTRKRFSVDICCGNVVP